jgi:hypothetical protein
LSQVARIAALLALAGCYDPELRDCTVTCATPADCAGGQLCSQDGFCVGRAFAGACTQHVLPPDAKSHAKDAAEPDGEDEAGLCVQGCANGTCDAHGVCVIDCTAMGACDMNDVICPPNLPCRVVCGDHACMHHVQCGLSTSCEVQCSGASSCGDTIMCNAGPCTVACSGASSCHKHTKCSMSCACDVTCPGTGACADPASECPLGPTCTLGKGCSSQLPGCDTCS